MTEIKATNVYVNTALTEAQILAVEKAKINPCPKCGGTVTVELWGDDDKKLMGITCPTCGFMYLAHGDLTDEQNLAAWNDQPVIQRLRNGIQNTLDLARTGLKPDIYPTELDWLHYKVNEISWELAQLLKP